MKSALLWLGNEFISKKRAGKKQAHTENKLQVWGLGACCLLKQESQRPAYGLGPALLIHEEALFN